MDYNSVILWKLQQRVLSRILTEFPFDASLSQLILKINQVILKINQARQP